MDLLKKRSSRRAKNYSNFLKDYIGKNKKILDIGLGDGTIAKQISLDCNADITGIDVIDYNKTDIPLTIYDGKKINFKDSSFDTVLIIVTLHHTEDPEQVIREAKRLAKNNIIIFEDVCNTKIQKLITSLYDFIMNIRHSVTTPFNFKSEKEWLQIFNNLNLKIEKTAKYPFNPWYCPTDTTLFVLRKW